MAPYSLALLIGVIAGLRAMTAPAAISWAARLGFLHLDTTPLAFLGYAATPYIVTLLAVVELVTDQLPSTPSRKVPMQFGARIVTGALSGAAIGASAGVLLGGLVAGAVGAHRHFRRRRSEGAPCHGARQGSSGRADRGSRGDPRRGSDRDGDCVTTERRRR